MGAMLAMLLTAPTISLDLEPGITCPTRERLARRLVAAGDAPSALQVKIHRFGSNIVVEGIHSDGRRLAREIPLEDDCGSVERAVTPLVLTWAWERLPTLPHAPVEGTNANRNFVGSPPVEHPRSDGGSPPPTERQQPEASSPARVERSRSEAGTAAATERPRPEASSPSSLERQRFEARTAVDSSTLSSGVDAGAPTALMKTAAPAPASTSASGRPGIELVLRGGLNGRAPPAPLPVGELALTLTWKWLGLSLGGGVTGSTEAPLGTGTISSSAGWASLGAAAAIPLTERLSFEAALGARLFVLQTSAHGYSQNQTATLISGGTFAEAGLSMRVAGPLVVGLWGEASVRPLEERLSVTGIADHLVIPRWQFGLLAGAGVQWR